MIFLKQFFITIESFNKKKIEFTSGEIANMRSVGWHKDAKKDFLI